MAARVDAARRTGAGETILVSGPLRDVLSGPAKLNVMDGTMT
jgi:hypothetical protein